ncbi:MAG: DUF4340 domain-containing protein [bacterium]
MARSTRNLFIAFVALLAFALVWKSAERRGTMSRTERFAEVDTSEVTRIELRGRGNDVTLVRRGGRWMLAEPASYPANEASVEDLLERAADLQVVNLVSSNPENHDLYEVGPDTGSLVRLLGGEEGDERLLAFYVGKLTSDFSHTYVRRFGSDDVYTAGGLLQGTFDKTASAWRDKTIFSAEPASVQRVELTSPGLSWTLLRQDVPGALESAAWTLRMDGEAVAADSTRAASLVRSLATLKAADFAGEGERTSGSWEAPDIRMSFTTSDGITRAFRGILPDEEASRYRVRKDGQETVFLVYKSTIDSLKRDRDALMSREEGDR